MCTHAKCLTPPLQKGLKWEEIMREPPHMQDRYLLMERNGQDSDWNTDRVTNAPP